MITSAIGSGTMLQGAPGAIPSPNVAATQPSDGGFESVLKSFAVNTAESLRTGETVAIAAIEGKASTQQAVMATMQAEQSLMAALAIRDKIVSAFLEISRMQI